MEVCSVVLAEVNEYFIFDLLLSRFFKKNLKVLLRNSSVNYYVYKNLILHTHPRLFFPKNSNSMVNR